MKRIISAVLAALLLVTMCACSQSEAPEVPDTPASGLYYELTGIHPQQTVITVDDNSAAMDLYCYWALYHADSLYSSLMMSYTMGGLYAECFDDTTGNLIPDATPEELGGMTLGEYVNAQALSTLELYIAAENMSEEYGVAMTEEQTAEMEAAIAASIEELGGETAFQEMLEEMGISQDSYERLTRDGYLVNNLLALVTQEGSPLYLDEADYEEYRVYADHILLATMDTATGEAYDEEKQLEQLGRARELLEQLDGLEGDALAERFTELADEYSEDNGRITNTGYVFGTGEMVQEFEDAAFGLQPGEISGIVESSYGYHIILRKELQPMLTDDLKAEIAQEHLPHLIQLYLNDADINVTSTIEKFSCLDFYNDYLDYTNAHASMDEVSGETTTE